MKYPFRTIVNPAPLPVKLSYQTPALFTGSCFTTSIGKKLQKLKFPVVTNPAGVLYNPVSIQKTIERLMEGKPYDKKDLLYKNGLWFSLMHDTSFSDEDPDVCLEKINKEYLKASALLKKTRFLFLTFGTAWTYVWKESGGITANCHKLPAARFKRRILEPEEILKEYHHLTEQLFSLNPELQIIFTVSPIRHWKDGPEGNQYSKSILLVAVHKLLEEDKRFHYFPSYEIMMDDLRDYRFYAPDMLHLSQVAVDYIWYKFRETIIDPAAYPVMNEVEKILQALTHRPFRPQSKEHIRFKNTQLKKIQDLENEYLFLNLSEEKEYFSSDIP